jgi:hypothetical protein
VTTHAEQLRAANDIWLKEQARRLAAERERDEFRKQLAELRDLIPVEVATAYVCGVMIGRGREM